jgi:acyl dehydratase
LPRVKLDPGTLFPEIKKLITQEHINQYAEASGDFNPIHLDVEFGKKMGLGGTIAHGMLVLAYISEQMTLCFDQNWIQNGKISVRFKAAANPGDMVTVIGKITHREIEDSQIIIYCDVICQNQNGEQVIVGETKVRISA